jgi:hypothetical protein
MAKHGSRLMLPSGGKTQVRLNARFYNAGFDLNFESYSCAQATWMRTFGRRFSW